MRRFLMVLLAILLLNPDPPTPEDRTTETTESNGQALRRDVGRAVVTYDVGKAKTLPLLKEPVGPGYVVPS